MKQFKAGYIVDAISTIITENFKPSNYFNESKDIEVLKVKGLLQNLSAFDVQFPYDHKIDYDNIPPVLATINNIITRGLPTKAPLIIEEKFVEIGLIQKNSNDSIFDYSKSVEQLNFNTIFELLHIIEPELKFDQDNYLGDLGSQLERKFIGNHQFVQQLFQAQRDFSTINPNLIGGKSVDFSFTSPYLFFNDVKKKTEYKTRIFEIDGPHHLLEEYIYYDTKRDLASSEENADTFRFNHIDIETNEISYATLFSEKEYEIFQKNYNRKITDYLTEYSLIFIPFAVARIQKTLLEHFIANSDLLKKGVLQIAIIERDLPCGALAIKILEDFIISINALLAESDKILLPKIELCIFENKKWIINQEQHCGYNPKNEDDFKADDFDVVIDHAIFKRSQIYKEQNLSSSKSIVIRSAHYYDNNLANSKKMYCANLLKYKKLVNKNNDGSYTSIKEYEKHINFFIQNIFRKKGFKDGQLPIISRALQQKPVIGLLPTGGGKSLTYQLPVFLQPGLCLIVDPIKSLMEDQVRVLNNNWIDCCDYINSNLNREKKQSKLIDFKLGQTLFLFVSPERFVMEDFRTIIKTIDKTQYKLAFSYCVIDEVHCLSEWGHDFRSTYLMLGKNAQEFIKTRKEKVTLIGLTATASYDVLADIERELNINNKDSADAVINIDNTIRKELFFDFILCNGNITEHSITDSGIKQRIGFIKRNELNNYVQNSLEKLATIDNEVIRQSLKQHYNEFELEGTVVKKETELINDISNIKSFEDATSIIFCPHTKGILGVTGRVHDGADNKEIFENLAVIDSKKSYFIGNDEAGKLSKEIHQHFIDFLDSKTKYMVCTKAFGMGIDKEDVRAVYHINYSSSPESYIQEAGRAGRDKKVSLCVNLINTEEFYYLNPEYVEPFPLAVRKKLRNLIESFTDKGFASKRFTNKETLINEIKLICGKYDETFEKVIDIKKGTDSKKVQPQTILTYNLDESNHHFFHNNSFKGIETEIFQLERFFTRKEDVYETTFKQITDIYNLDNKTEINFRIEVKKEFFLGDILLTNEFGVNFGKIIKTRDNKKLTVDFNFGKLGGVHNIPLTNHIFDFIISQWKTNSPDATLFDYLRKPVENIINNGQCLKEFFESESTNVQFIVPLDLTKDTLFDVIIRDFELTTEDMPHIHNAKDYLETLQKQSYNFKDYIQRIEESWSIDILQSEMYKVNKKHYKKLYYSNIEQQDVLRIIYRLYSIQFISDYTIDYNKGLVTISVNKEDKNFYINATKQHLLKYLSKEYTTKKIEELVIVCAGLNAYESIKKAVKVILEFTYSDIVKKRKRAIADIREFITESISINQNSTTDLKFKNAQFNSHFKQLMYYYFNAKYARIGYIDPQFGNCSLIDDFKNKELDDWEAFTKYTEILNNKASFINECKMMRGSCKRIWRSKSEEETKNEYILHLLYAYATFGLNNPYYYPEAENHFLDGFEKLYLKTDYSNFENKLNEFLVIFSKSVKYENAAEYVRRTKHKLMLKISTKNVQNLIQELSNI